MTDEQERVYRAVETWLTEHNQTTMPLDTLSSLLGLPRDDLDPILWTLASEHLDVREDQPNSPGWVAVDQISQ